MTKYHLPNNVAMGMNEAERDSKLRCFCRHSQNKSPLIISNLASGLSLAL